MKLPLFFSSYRKDLAIIEQELRGLSQSNSAILQSTTSHLVKSGGKRLRPIFVLLCAKFGDYDIHQVKYSATALELIHSASLAHDDVIDNAKLRRGVETISAEWDNRVATYTGDYIFMHAMQLVSKLNNPVLHQILAKTIVELCIGEMEQIQDKYNFDQNLRNYLRRIKRKTALLIAASGQLGAATAGVTKEMQQKLFLFGYYVGMSFQIIDDVLDFTASEKKLGKPAGGDLLQGNITLPALYAMENPNLKAKIVTVHSEMGQQELVPILDEIRASGAIEKCLALSQRYLQLAIRTIEHFPNTKHKKNLLDIAKYLGKRTY